MSAVRFLPFLGLLAATPLCAAPVSYNFEVRPLLSGKCFACHGMDAAKRKADLRLDDRSSALTLKAIVPGDPAASGIIQRARSTDPEEVMPPPEKHAALTTDEISLLERWISEGATYEKHWAFVPPRKPAISPQQGEHPIDALIRTAAAARQLSLAPEATPREWLRRVSFALTGLPPSPEESDAFAANPSPEARPATVDRLLASPHFGERMATDWLDAARYADTYGRHEDSDSSVWPWRDWVIRAFQQNLPYDQFIVWQTAGDLLPNPTQDQHVATAFQRLPVQSNESGSDPEEFRWDQVFDRVRTTTSAFLGLTLECARCHDHKYDPFTMRDFYRMAAYLNNIDELGLFARYANGIPAPTRFVFHDGQAEKHATLKAEIAKAEAALTSISQGARQRFETWLHNNAPPGCGEGLWLESVSSAVKARRTHFLRKPTAHLSFDLIEPKDRFLVADNDRTIVTDTIMNGGLNREGKFGGCAAFPKKVSIPSTGTAHRWQPFSFSFWLKLPETPDHGVSIHRSRAGIDSANRGYEITFENGHLTATLGHFYPGNALRIQLKSKPDLSDWKHVGFTYDGSSSAAGMRLFIDGQPQDTTTIRDHLIRDIDYLPEWGDLDTKRVADAEYGEKVTLTIGARTLDASMRSGAIDELRFYALQLSPAEMTFLAGKTPPEPAWFDWYFREIDPEGRRALAHLRDARAAENEFTIPLTEIMVMQEQQGPRRATPILARGDFRQPGETVEPGVPDVLLPMPDGAPANRLGLAQWLTHPSHPLTARVAVNRLWMACFGHGLVPTPEDFGLQGRAPANPALLDWLAVHFIESGWNVKSLLRAIVLSKTFARSSDVNAATLAKDPDNAWLARGPRFRLSAEQLRDATLAASGLLVRDIGGPSVKPWQPPGLWEDSGTQHSYTPDSGRGLHRRSLYSFWRRTCPPPLLSVFDAPTREFCRVRRDSTLTPLQSLAFQNDLGILEAARVLAERILDPLKANASSPETPESFARSAWAHLAANPPSPSQLHTVAALFRDSLAHYQKHPDDASQLVAATGSAPVHRDIDQTLTAAGTVTIRALFNADTFLCSY